MMGKLGAVFEGRRSCPFLVMLVLACGALVATASAQAARIKRVSLMTGDLDQSIAFFTDVVGFTLDFYGTLPAGGEPFLGPVFNIDVTKPIRRALLSTSTEPRGLFLIEHLASPVPDPGNPTAVVTVVQVENIEKTLEAARVFGAPISETVTDVTPEGMRFIEAMIKSPGGHAILVYEIGSAENL